MPSLAITTLWWTLGFNFVLYLAGLQEIPRDLYEASAIDGAGPWQQIRKITIPLLGRTTTLVAVLQVIASLKVFDQMYIMTQGGPNFATRSILQLVYDEGFTELPHRLRGRRVDAVLPRRAGRLRDLVRHRPPPGEGGLTMTLTEAAAPERSRAGGRPARSTPGPSCSTGSASAC